MIAEKYNIKVQNMFLPIVLSYFIVILFIWYTYNTNKPIKYVNLFKMIKFNYHAKSELNGIDQIPGPMRLLFLGTRWILWNHPIAKLHELYKSKFNLSCHYIST